MAEEGNKLAFEQITLTKEELSTLKALKRADTQKQGILVNQKNKTVLDRLYHFELAEIHSCSTAPPGETLKFPFPRAAYITDCGKDYLAYLEAQKRAKKSDRRHDILLLFISASIAVFFDHFDDILDILRLFVNFIREHH